MNREITKRQKDVLLAVQFHISQQGYPPTYRELAEILNLGSTNAVYNHIMALERKGYVETGFGKARAIKVTNSGYIVKL